MRRWWSENWLTVLLGLLGAVGIGTVVAVIGDVISMAFEHPVPLGAFGAFMFLLGMGFAYLVGVRDWLRAKRERREALRERAAAEDRAEREKRAEETESAISRFKSVAGQNADLVMICLAIYDQGGSLLVSTGCGRVIEGNDRYAFKMFDYTPKGGGSCEVSLKSWARLALESEETLMRGYDQQDYERIGQYLLDDAESVARSRGEYD